MGGLTIAGAILEILGFAVSDEYRKSLYEGGPNNGGDEFPGQTNPAFSAVKHKISETGTSGHDQIYGNDDIFDGGADDSINAGAGDDVVFAGDGDDTVYGGADNDLLYGGEGEDSLRGDAGNDVLRGGADNDTLEGGADDDTLIGGEGNDFLIGGDGNDYLYGDAGVDRVAYSYAGSSVTIDLIAGTASVSGGGDSDILVDIEHIIGSDFNDVIIGKAGFYFLEGGLGDDVITFEAGNILRFNNVFDNDIATGSGWIIVNNQFIRGEATNNEDGTYSLKGLTLTPGSGGLLIESGASSVTITDWADGRNGIKLSLSDNEDTITPAGKNMFIAANAARFMDPLVLDLDGDGIELLEMENGALFDLTGDGVMERTGWVAPDDGLLVIDRNGNGQIDDIAELFGSEDINGFTDLANEEALGSNNNRIINLSDTPLWEQLKIWQDANGDGFVDEGELSSLAAHDIVEIDIQLSSIQHDNRWVAGNQVVEVSTFTRGDTTTGEIAEVLFRVDAESASETLSGIYIGSDAALLALPKSRGYGDLVSWQDAMDTNATLRGLIENFAARTDYDGVDADVEEILYEWAGVGAVLPNSRGAHFSGQKLAFLEKLYSETYTGGTLGNPNSRDAALLEQVWDTEFSEFKERLLIQGPLTNIFPNATYSFVNDEIQLNDTLNGILTRIEQSDFIGNTAFLMTLRGILYSHAEDLGVTTLDINSAISGSLAEALGDPALASVLIGAFDASSVVSRATRFGDEFIAYQGGFRDDLIISNDKNSILAGGAGADLIIGGKGNDILFNAYDATSFGDPTENYFSGLFSWGNPSNSDSLFGGSGNDQFIIGGYDVLAVGGAGNDSFVAYNEFYETVGGVTLSGGDGDDTFGYTDYLTSNQISYMYGMYLVESTILGGAGNDRVVDANQYGNMFAHNYIDLGDGDDVFESYNKNTVYGGDGNDTITGGGHSWDEQQGSYYDGGDGNDVITLVDSLGTVVGGAGDDTIYVQGGQVSSPPYMYQFES